MDFINRANDFYYSFFDCIERFFYSISCFLNSPDGVSILHFISNTLLFIVIVLLALSVILSILIIILGNIINLFKSVDETDLEDLEDL